MKGTSKNIFGILFLLLMISGCGRVPVHIDDSTYIPKIVVDGYLIPKNNIENVRIMRNYGLNTVIDINEIVIEDAVVQISEMETGLIFDLSYDTASYAYRYEGDFSVNFGNQYQLFVEANIGGQRLTTTATTTVPEEGFSIDRDQSQLTPLTYRERDETGDYKRFQIAFNRSPSTSSYISSIVALDAADSTFIENNAFGIKTDDLDEDENLLQELAHQGDWILTEMGGDGISYSEVEWFCIWFYGRYRLILYAADRNYTDFFLTHRFVQEIDGNLLEPKFHFEGDGIGIFGSAVPDTVYFEVIRNL